MNRLAKRNLTRMLFYICDELEEKNPEKTRYYRDLKREAVSCDFNILPNLCDIVVSHYDALERETVINFIRTMQLLQGQEVIYFD